MAIRALALAATTVLVGTAACEQTRPAGGPMTRDEANRLIQSFAQSQGGQVSGLNMNNMSGLSLGESDLFFTFHQPLLPNQPTKLEVSALIYRFRKDPDPEILAGFREEQAAGTPSGGGEVDFEPENKGLYLTRFYEKVPDQDTFNAQLLELAKASKVWGREVLERVANKVNSSK